MSRLRSAVQKRKRAALENTERIKSSNKKKSKPAIKEVCIDFLFSPEELSETEPSSYHFFHDATEISRFRTHLLQWYDQNKRELPWRTLVKASDILNFCHWVSEIIWMKRWPTVEKLAAATLEEVNQMWPGLGYYSRGRRLHEGAQKVVSELDGQMPKTTAGLLKQLPGVGRYTAVAISSIALGQVTGAVDGNVIRVLCHVRAIGANGTRQFLTHLLTQRPGDFNQAMMELGARVCTPKSPLCSQCPVQNHCHAFRKVLLSMPDLEDCCNSCDLCLSEDWDPQLGVQNYPRKPVKKAPHVEQTLTCIYLLTQRPSKGLLAGMWELPSMLLEADVSENKYNGLICDMMQKLLETAIDALFHILCQVVHIFSHIHQTYIVFSVHGSDWSEGEQEQKTCWLTKSALQGAAVSTGVKKVVCVFSWVSQQSQTSQCCKLKLLKIVCVYKKNLKKWKKNESVFVTEYFQCTLF
uniref:Adenine DNA glycosylase n=1 Tax=Sinocyclocheilus anshuiensis TaxID=1608454 RepID=A0A671R0C3_9TELE